MASDNKENERAKLHKTIWRIANDLRGSVDGWDFKSYVLSILFYRFISENLTDYLNQQERQAGHSGFDYATLSYEDALLGRQETLAEKGFYILPPHLSANARQCHGLPRTATIRPRSSLCWTSWRHFSSAISDWLKSSRNKQLHMPYQPSRTV